MLQYSNQFTARGVILWLGLKPNSLKNLEATMCHCVRSTPFLVPRQGILLENVGALLSCQTDTRKVFTFILQAWALISHCVGSQFPL